jgi:hypothetical protein
MLLRDHPLMSYKGNRSWPPSWLRRGNQTTNPQGEVGILKDVIPSSIEPYDKYFVIMEHSGAEYVGVLLVRDTALREIFGILLQNRGKTIEEIGNIDLADTL